MSEKPRRWDIECTGIGDDVDMVERPKGNYVLMEDYARLKAEVEQLMVFCNCTLIPNKELQAKVERLTKAGDNVVADLEHLTKSGWFDKCKSVKRWNAAKEGKPSE